MAYIVKDDGKNFKPCPEGLFQAVCCDVVDLGEEDNSYNPGKTQRKVRVVWQVDETDPDNHNKPFIVARKYTASLNEKASLRKDLESWRGRKFTAEEQKAFDLELLLGVNCQVNVVHFTNEKGTYANVATLVPLGKSTPKISVRDYVRVKYRDPKDQTSEGHSTDDDVPF